MSHYRHGSYEGSLAHRPVLGTGDRPQLGSWAQRAPKINGSGLNQNAKQLGILTFYTQLPNWICVMISS